MNIQEYLLTCIGEECAEIIHSVSKSLRFGLKDTNPKTQIENLQNLKNEVSDLIAVIRLLENHLKIDIFQENSEKIKIKQEKVIKWMKYSLENGRLI